MKKDKIYLGIYEDEKIYLSKHSWNCNWYWGFGYVGNSRWHFHFETFLSLPDKKRGYGIECDPSNIFSETWISQKAWWILRDIFIQAYALRRAAEVYQYGGHQTSSPGITDIIKDLEKVAMLNSDLEKILDTIWNFLLSEEEQSS